MEDARTQNIIKEQYKKLPKDVQDAVLSVNLRDVLKKIGDKHRLHIDQIGVLETETLFIMLGMEHPRNYVRNVAKELNVDIERAKKIAVDINEQIFRNIRESLKKIHNISEQITDNGQQAVSGRQSVNQTSAEQSNPQPATYNLQPVSDEQPILQLKKETSPISVSQKSGLGWPVKKDEETSLTDKKTASENFISPVQNKLKQTRPFFKITPDDKQKMKELRIITQSEKSAPAPQNLPVENAPDEVNMLANSIEKKLSGTFKLPRTETKYKNAEPHEPPLKNKYGESDPYREPIK